MNYLQKAFMIGVVAAVLGGCSESSTGKGEGYFKAGQYQEAVDAYSKTLNIDPNNAQLLYNRGRAYDELDNNEAAIKDLKAALKLDDKNVRYLISLGDVYYKQKIYDKALFYYEQATEMEGNNALALYKEAKANHQLGNVKEAMNLYAAALRENEKMGEAFLSRAALKISQDDKSGGCEDLRKAESLGASGAAEALAKYCN